MPKIKILTEASAPKGKAAFPTLSRMAPLQTVEVETKVLTANLQRFLKEFETVFDDASKWANFEIGEVELSLTVNAEGGIELVGKLTAGAEATIKIKLRPRKT
jgi:hypothetical protein